MAILVTGGAGYVGSHVCLELIREGYEIVIVDDFRNSDRSVISALADITGIRPKIYDVDIKNGNALNYIFVKEKIDTVIHLAAYKAVNESVKRPVEYYLNNVSGLLTILEVMKDRGIKNLIFSSSATVYGEPDDAPICEDHALEAKNPYGRSKIISEQILNDLYNSDPDWNIIIFRYFNPIGADASGLIGENPRTGSQNLIPKIVEVLRGETTHLSVYGYDYSTRDGTAIRDYVHISDIAKAHVKGIERIAMNKGIDTYNLGTGKGYTVLEVIEAYQSACGRSIPFDLCERREGDAMICYCDASKAERELNWKAERSLNEMCEDSWRWENGRSGNKNILWNTNRA